MKHAHVVLFAVLVTCFCGVIGVEAQTVVAMDKEAVAGHGILTLSLRLESGDDVLFLGDTGSPVTLLDKSLKGKLGQRLERFSLSAWQVKQNASVYPAPKVFLGERQLITGS